MIFLAMVIASCLYKNNFNYKKYFGFHYVRVNIGTNRKLRVKGFPSQSHMLTIPNQERTRQAGNPEQEMHMRYGRGAIA